MTSSAAHDPNIDELARPSSDQAPQAQGRFGIGNVLKVLVSIGLTVAVFYLIFTRGDGPSFDTVWVRFSAKLFVMVVALCMLATALSVWRLKLIAQDLGYRLSVRDSIAALSLGLLAGTIFFQLVGQLMARGALLSRRGMPVAATITLTVYEQRSCRLRIPADGHCGRLVCFWPITALDIQHGELLFLKLLAGMTVALAGWRVACLGFESSSPCCRANLDRRPEPRRSSEISC